MWTNLLDNAAYALLGEGRIAIRTRAEKEHVVVEIEDSGPGIPPPIQSQIFDAFFTTKPPGQGTGLVAEHELQRRREEARRHDRRRVRPGSHVFLRPAPDSGP